MKWVLFGGLLVILVGCAGDSPGAVDLVDCKRQTVPITQLDVTGRLPNHLILRSGDESWEISKPLDITGTASIATCKSYIKGTTLYAGEVTTIESLLFTTKGGAR